MDGEISVEAQFILNNIAGSGWRGVTRKKSRDDLRGFIASAFCCGMGDGAADRHFGEALDTRQIAEHEGLFYSTESYVFRDDFGEKH